MSRIFNSLEEEFDYNIDLAISQMQEEENHMVDAMRCSIGNFFGAKPDYIDTPSSWGTATVVISPPTSIEFIPVSIEIDAGPTKDNICCSNPKNHKKVWLITSAYKMCEVCKNDLGDWKDA